MTLSAAYAVLFGSVVCEVVGTSALLASQHFSRLLPTCLVVVCYAAALVGISFTFRLIPMGIVYAIWSGMGMVMIAAVGWVAFGQRIDLPGAVGLGLIVSGVTVINVWSSALAH